MGKHEDIWNVAKNIEGLISRRGVHASGIILTNDKFTELGATMKSPKGVKCSQWELHDEEYAGHIKYDKGIYLWMISILELKILFSIYFQLTQKLLQKEKLKIC